MSELFNLGRFIKDKLRAGVVPTVEELKAVDTGPVFKLSDHSVEFGSEVSASELNKAARDLEAAIVSVYEQLQEAENQHTVSINKIKNKTREMKSRLVALENDIDLLSGGLAVQETINLDFRTPAFVDTVSTTAFVSDGAAILSQTGTDPFLVSLQFTDFVPIVSPNTFLSSTELSPFNSLQNGLFFIKQVSYPSRQDSVRYQNTITFTEAKTIGSLFLDTGQADTICGVFISTDGVSYETVATFLESSKVQINKDILGLRIILQRDRHDYLERDSFIYEFVIKKLMVSEEIDDYQASGLVQTLSLSSRNPFTSGSIAVCESVPLGSSITYSLSTDGETYTTLSPINSPLPGNKVINFSTLTELSFDAELSFDQAQVIVSGELTSTALDIPLSDSGYLSVGTDVEFSSLVVRRNLGTLDGSPADPENLARGFIKGWKDKGEFYSSEFINSKDQLLDIGNFNILLDGQVFSGSFTIPAGHHTIEVPQVLWFNVVGTVETEEDLIALDPHYPINMKYIVEGFPYPSNFVGKKVYPDQNLFWEKTETQYRLVPTDTENFLIEVPINKNILDYRQESFQVLIKYSDRSFTSIYLKALLQTTNSLITPKVEQIKISLAG